VAADKTKQTQRTRKGARRHELMVAGLGGQGALLATQILVEGGLLEYPHVSWFPSYATFVRGGDCEGTAILSDEPIHSPLVYQPSALIVMSASSMEALQPRIAPGSLLILDSTLITQWNGREDVTAVRVPATAKATELGSRLSANLLLLGVYLKRTGALTLEAAENALREKLEGKESFLPKNLEALRWGYQHEKDFSA
jgi:2-oxoglutarate ferredoxin oxidoreductase subunit gamma